MLFLINYLVLFISTASAHTWIECTNTYPRQWKETMEGQGNLPYDATPDCFGFPRGLPAFGPSPVYLSPDNSANIDAIQAYPYSYIWNTANTQVQSKPSDAGQVCNPVQRSVNYTNSFMAYMKQGATTMLRWSAWDHQRNPKTPGTGLIRIYWMNGGDITNLDELTSDRIVSENGWDEYMPTQSATERGDGRSYYPFALIDQSGKPLPTGRNSFVFAWFWKNIGEREQHNTWPDFTTCFDIWIADKNDPEADGGFFQFGNVTWNSSMHNPTDKNTAYESPLPLNITHIPDGTLAAQRSAQEATFHSSNKYAISTNGPNGQPTAWVLGHAMDNYKIQPANEANVANINAVHKTPTTGNLNDSNGNKNNVTIDNNVSNSTAPSATIPSVQMNPANISSNIGGESNSTTSTKSPNPTVQKKKKTCKQKNRRVKRL